MEGRQPDCAEIFTDERRHDAAGKRKFIDYLVCNNEATLLWMINMGCIDVNPWNSRVQTPDEPDWIVIDLDPSEDSLSSKGLSRLRTTAMAARDFCKSNKLKVFAKSSGKTGMHFLVPCGGFKSAEARALGEQICAGIHALVPNDSTITVSKDQRKGKVFVDFSQNDYADTISAPYCVRPFRMPLVSTPLDLKEISATLDPRKFDMPTIMKRLKRKGDLWDKIGDPKIIDANNRVLKKW
jgi:bifunctional non-homologous end joining protein LigD